MPAAKYSIEEQENMIMDAAVAAIEESSLLDFKMSDIAKRAGLSMGSVYKHIQSKEDVLVALATRISERSAHVFKDVLTLPYSPASKLVAIQLLNPLTVNLYCFGAQLIMLVANGPVLSRTSPRWRDQLLKDNQNIQNLFQDLMDQAQQTQQLQCSAEQYEQIQEEICLGHWSLNVGFMQATYQQQACGMFETHAWPYPLSAEHPFTQACIRLTNAYPWKTPVSLDELKQLIHELDALGYR